MTDRRDAPDAEAGEGVCLPRGGSPQRRFPEDQGKAGRIDAIDAAHEDQEGLQAVVAVGNPDQRFDDLAELRPDRGGGFFRGGRLAIEGHDLECDSLALRSLEDAPVGGVEGHGPECTIAANPERVDPSVGELKNGTGERLGAESAGHQPQTLGT